MSRFWFIEPKKKLVFSYGNVPWKTFCSNFLFLSYKIQNWFSSRTGRLLSQTSLNTGRDKKTTQFNIPVVYTYIQALNISVRKYVLYWGPAQKLCTLWEKSLQNFKSENTEKNHKNQKYNSDNDLNSFLSKSKKFQSIYTTLHYPLTVFQSVPRWNSYYFLEIISLKHWSKEALKPYITHMNPSNQSRWRDFCFILFLCI